jgi:hypothetical protein
MSSINVPPAEDPLSLAVLLPLLLLVPPLLVPVFDEVFVAELLLLGPLLLLLEEQAAASPSAANANVVQAKEIRVVGMRNFPFNE